MSVVLAISSSAQLAQSVTTPLKMPQKLTCGFVLSRLDYCNALLSGIDFKLASLCFKFLNGSAHTYLSDLLHLYTLSRQVRSSANTRVFRIPSFHTKSSGQRSFSYRAPATWKKLPASIRHASSVSSFRSSLKTFLFSKTFSSIPCPEVTVCDKVCVCVQVCVFERTCMCLLFVYLNF